MPVQSFTQQEEVVLREAGVALAQTIGGVSQRQNMTKAEQKANDAALVQAKINALQDRLDNIDAIYAALKTNESSSLNSQITFLTDLKTKIENTPE